MFSFKVYVGCGLTLAPDGFRRQVEDLKVRLGGICEVLSFLNFYANHSPHEVYKWDIHRCVAGCDLLLAICDEPSIGLGYEMATQVEKHRKPVLAVAHTNSLVTALVLDPQQPGYEFRRYQNLLTDVPELVIERLERMEAEREALEQREYPLLQLLEEVAA